MCPCVPHKHIWQRHQPRLRGLPVRKIERRHGLDRCLAVPGAPSSLDVRVAGEDALSVRIGYPDDDGGANVTYYRLIETYNEPTDSIASCADLLDSNTNTNGFIRISTGDDGSGTFYCDVSTPSLGAWMRLAYNEKSTEGQPAASDFTITEAFWNHVAPTVSAWGWSNSPDSINVDQSWYFESPAMTAGGGAKIVHLLNGRVPDGSSTNWNGYYGPTLSWGGILRTFGQWTSMYVGCGWSSRYYVGSHAGFNSGGLNSAHTGWFIHTACNGYKYGSDNSITTRPGISNNNMYMWVRVSDIIEPDNEVTRDSTMNKTDNGVGILGLSGIGLASRSVAAHACNSLGCSLDSTSDETSVPSAPSSLEVRVAGEDALSVRIGYPDDDGGANVTHFHIGIMGPSNPCATAAVTGVDENSGLFCEANLAGKHGWTLYMVNGKGAQHKDSLKLGANPDGTGDPVSELGDADTELWYKMSESRFDELGFQEIVATAGSDWVKITKDGGAAAFTKDEAFAVGWAGFVRL